MDARGTAALVDHPDTAGGIGVAEVAPSIVGGASNDVAAAGRWWWRRRRIIPIARRWRIITVARRRSVTCAQHKGGAAALVDPDAGAVVSPGLPLNAGGSAILLDQGDTIAGVDIAIVALEVIGGTGKVAPILTGEAVLRGGARSNDHAEQ